MITQKGLSYKIISFKTPLGYKFECIIAPTTMMTNFVSHQTLLSVVFSLEIQNHGAIIPEPRA